MIHYISKYFFKKNSIHSLILACFMACQSINFKEKILQNIEVSSLILLGNTVQFDLKIQIPKAAIKKKYTYLFEPIFFYGDNKQVKLPAINVQLADNKNDYKIAKKYHMPYKNGMQTGTLRVKWSIKNKQEKIIEENSTPLQKGIITTAKLAQVPQAIVYQMVTAEKEDKKIVETSINFKKGKGNITKAEEEILKKRLHLIKSNGAIQINIQGSHSPEGPSPLNKRLVNSRLKSTKNVIKKYLKEKDIDFNQSSLYNNWDLMKVELQNSKNICPKTKQHIIGIINEENSSFEAKERKIQKLNQYEIIKSSLYPLLRTAIITIDYTQQPKTEKMVYMLAKNSYEKKMDVSLTSQEWQLAGYLEKKDIIFKKYCFEQAHTIHPDDIAYCNLGNVYLEHILDDKNYQKDVPMLCEEAKKNFSLALQKNPNNALAHIHLAFIGYLQNDFTFVQKHVDAAVSFAQEKDKEYVFNICIPLYIQLGAYAQALDLSTKLMPNAQDFYHSALAAILQKNYEKASTYLDKFIVLDNKQQSAYSAFYLKAIIAARTNDVSSLKYFVDLVQKNKNLSTNPYFNLAKDQEFKHYPEIIAQIIHQQAK